jgi:hypothetical protein
MRAGASISVLGFAVSVLAVCACGSSEELSVGDRSAAGSAAEDSGSDGRVPEVVMWRLVCKISCPDASSSTGAGLPTCTALQTTGSACTTPGVSCDPQVGPSASCAQGYYQRCGGNALAIPCL